MALHYLHGTAVHTSDPGAKSICGMQACTHSGVGELCSQPKRHTHNKMRGQQRPSYRLESQIFVTVSLCAAPLPRGPAVRPLE